METKIIKENKEAINKAIEELKNGNIIAFKTDTIYGFSCNATNENACEKITEIKGRENKPMILLCGKNLELEKYVELESSLSKNIAKKCWPNPITIIFNSKYNFNEYVSNNSKTIGFRFPKDKLCEQILNNIDFPIVSTSANISGEKSIDNAQEIFQKFNGKISLIIDSGKTQDITASTIVDASSSELEILREGKITKEQIENMLK